jgi:hypothetical protein
MWFISPRSAQAPESVWVMQLIFAVMVCLSLFAAGVLVIRLALPAYRKWLTVALNIVLLMLVPFGTALAVYGLWKADRISIPSTQSGEAAA